MASMKRHFVLVGAIVFAFLLFARGEGPDDKYVQVYSLIEEADGLNDAGHGREAAIKYFEAQKALKALQNDYPTWNGNVINFRLGYIASKLEPLTQKAAPTNAPAVLAESPAPPTGTNQIK